MVDVSPDAPRWWHYLWPTGLLAVAFVQPWPFCMAPAFVAGMWAGVLLAWHDGWRKLAPIAAPRGEIEEDGNATTVPDV